VSVDPSDDETEAAKVEAYFSADRAKAFVDAVVAIALTLLILPLLEAITGLARVSGTKTQSAGETVPSAAEWFGDNWLLLVSFLISFVVIAMFWVNHHRMYAAVRRVSTRLLWLNIAWLLTIVWLPVATTMTSVMDGDDPLVKVSYIGTMALTSLLTFFQELYLRAHPDLHDIGAAALLRGLAVSLSMTGLFLAGLAIAILFPTTIGYFGLFLLALTGQIAKLIARALGVRKLPKDAGAPERG
jgi:uncharacterized membrane protein